MKIVALLTVRNEELYIKRCLEHLISQGIEICLIDNESTDKTLSIAKTFVEHGVVRIEKLAYPGYFSLIEILRNEERLALEIKADWFIHHDADEIREAPMPCGSLREGIEDADRKGYNAVNFDEFVFVPTSKDDSYKRTDYVNEMKHYYYFSPKPLHRVNAWKNLGRHIDLSQSAGHEVQFDDRKIFSQNFILRHYIVLSTAHAIKKYQGTTYSPYEVNVLGWYGPRPFFNSEKLHFSSPEKLKKVSLAGQWDRSDPRISHEFFGSFNGIVAPDKV